MFGYFFCISGNSRNEYNYGRLIVQEKKMHLLNRDVDSGKNVQGKKSSQ